MRGDAASSTISHSQRTSAAATDPYVKTPGSTLTLHEKIYVTL